MTDVLLILEVIPPFEADDRQVLSDLRASAEGVAPCPPNGPWPNGAWS